MQYKSVMSIVVGWLLLSVALGAQGNSWAEVQALSPGQQVEVTSKNKPFIRGEFQSATDLTLVVMRGGTTIDYIARDDVQRVLAYIPGERSHKGLLIGLAIAVPSGLVSIQGSGDARGIPIAIGFFGGIGALMDHFHNREIRPMVIYSQP